MKKLFLLLSVLLCVNGVSLSYADDKAQTLSIESLFLTADEEAQATTTVGDAVSSCNMYGTTQVCLTISPRGSCARVSTPSGSHTIGDNC
jgi:hypothetical protein